MWQAILGALRSGYQAVRGAVSKGAGGVRWAVTRDPEAMARYRRKPSKFPMPRTPFGQAMHSMAEFGNASWGIDSLAARFASSAPTYSETVTVKVWGQRWALIQDLYVLAMCIIANRVDGRSWQGGQGIRCLIDVTGKYVEAEFTQAKHGIAERAGTLAASVFGPNRSPFVLFHDPGWLTNEVSIQGKDRAIARLPDVLAPASGTVRQAFEGYWANRDLDAAAFAQWGGFTGNMVVNQGPDGSQNGPVLITHDREVNPYPISDGSTRGTDLCTLVTQALHGDCDPPPVPTTDHAYQPDGNSPDSGGCRNYKVPRPLVWQWLFQAAANAARWARGWHPLNVNQDRQGAPQQAAGRPFGNRPC